MQVCLHLVAVSEPNIELLREQPKLVWNLVFTSPVMGQQAGQVDRGRPASRHQLEPQPVYLHETLGNYWHGIHYLLTRNAWAGTMPQAFLLEGGEFVGDVDMGYGPARLFTSEETASIASTLTPLPATHLRCHFDPCIMLDEEVYPPLLWVQETTALAACLERFKALQHFLHHAAENRFGLLLYLQPMPSPP